MSRINKNSMNAPLNRHPSLLGAPVVYLKHYGNGFQCDIYMLLVGTAIDTKLCPSLCLS